MVACTTGSSNVGPPRAGMASIAPRSTEETFPLYHLRQELGKLAQERPSELPARFERYLDAVVTGMALNHLGTADPAPLARVALRAYLDFHQAALDEWRGSGLDLGALLAVLERTLTATVAAISD